MLLNLFNEEEEEVEEEGRSHSREQSQSRGLGERRKEGGEERLDTCKGHLVIRHNNGFHVRKRLKL